MKKEWLAEVITGAIIVAVVGGFVLALLWMGHEIVTYSHRTSHFTARVTKLFQEQSQTTINDYMRVTTADGKTVVWGAWPEVWGLVEEGMTCQFEVRDETHVAVNAVCQDGDR
jgi:hypothetical protein